ncbi:kinase-like domain-containing protein [Crassisporium funariophilum]|nr:kinase-like domain-containing protein [Crassisporium funariophilum]
MNTPEGTRKWLFYAFLGMIADTLDIILTSVIPDKRPQRSIVPSDVDQLSNEEILKLGKNSSKLRPDAGVVKLTPGTVAKGSQAMVKDAADASEANALDLLFAETTIPVPRVRRVVKRQWDFWIVMDYIPGPTLAHVWGTLSTWQKVRVAFTLRRYVRQLRRLKASATTPPGPLSAQGARICESPIFGQVQFRRGPFASYSELSDFFNKRQQMAMDAKKLPRDDPSRNELFDNSEPLVLTHQNLNRRHVIVGEDGRLWIINWEWAGYYPPWFEYVAMQRQNEDERISGTDDEFWEALIPFICGPYFRQERWLSRMSLGLYFR